MNAALGRTGVILSLLAAGAGIVTIVWGLARDRPSTLASARRYVYLLLAGALLSTFAMQRALVTHDFSLAYVAANNSRETPVIFSITGMWSALAGSILLWGVILAGYLAAMVVWARRRADSRIVAWATLAGLVVAVFFFALMAGPANPFAATPPPLPVDGLGPNPLLQDNILVAFHPVFLYLGFVGMTIPFAFAVAALVTGRLGEGWLVATRRWTLFAWGFLTVGLVLGAWWSYQVLGWGGYWAWDPVENAAFLPWLCTTAYLHSVMAQERRGLLRVWNISLLLSAFSLTILATFLTRSGVLVSVHSFTESDVGPEILAFFGLVVATGVGLIAWRGDRLRSPATVDAAVSREGAFLLNNMLFGAFAVVVLLGTVFPLLVEAWNGNQLTIGKPYFDTLTVPIGIALLFLMAVAPALPWRKASPGMLRRRLAVPAWVAVLVLVICVAAGVRGLTPLAAFGLASFAGASALRQIVLAALASRRRGEGAWRGLVGRSNGGMVVHLGVVVVAVGLAASSSFGQRASVTLAEGRAASVDGHTFRYLGAAPFVTSQKHGVQAAIEVDGRSVFRPAITEYGADTEGVGTPAIDSGAVDDVYLTLSSSPANGHGPVELNIVVQPLVLWLWVGGALTAAGALLAAVPGRRRRRDSGRSAEELPPVGEEEELRAEQGAAAEPVGAAR